MTLCFRKPRYIDDDFVGGLDLKPRNSSVMNGQNSWSDANDEHSLIEKPKKRNYFQDGLQQNNNIAMPEKDSPSFTVRHSRKSDVPALPFDQRYSIGPILLQDDSTSTQHTYDTAYTHGTFKKSSEA